MSVINPGNNLQFKTTDSLFGRIRKRLRSFNAAGIIDEGDWYYLIKDLLNQIGCAVYDEREAVIIIKDFKAPLPEDFMYMYAAYKCTPNIVEGKSTVFPQTGFVMYLDETHESYQNKRTRCGARREMCGDKVTIRTVIEGQPIAMNLDSPVLLRLSGNAKGICADKCANLFAKSPAEITISGGHIFTNFNNDSILMKYYAFAVDKDSGLPLVPDNTFIEKALEDYIIYRTLEDLFINGEAPDIENRYRLAKMNSDVSLAQAVHLAKLPSFQAVLNKIRVDRNNLGIYQQIAR